MKSPRHLRRHNVGFQMLSKEAQERLLKYEYAVIWLLVLIAITSIVWSISLHIVSGDFSNGVVGAKLIFTQRDFERMNQRSKEIFYHDLGEVLNRTYTDAALEGKLLKTTDTIVEEDPINDKNNDQSEAVLKATDETTTMKPKKRRILHLFQTSSSMDEQKDSAAKNNDQDEVHENDADESDDANRTTVLKKRYIDVDADREFLSTMMADVDQDYWRNSIAIQYVYSFPFLTEIMAIIWAAMCLVFQTSVKKYWGLPKPWRIVVPSIVVFTLMTLGSLIYTIITNRLLKLFCTSLREPLSDPTMISCGDAMSVLRPMMKRHQFGHDVYLTVFRISYILSLLLWALALVIMVLRYIFAIDFQLVDVRLDYESPDKQHQQRRRSSELSGAKQKITTPKRRAPTKMLRVDERARHKSEDDFESAKSNISEVATPLLENTSKATTAAQSKIV